LLIFEKLQESPENFNVINQTGFAITREKICPGEKRVTPFWYGIKIKCPWEIPQRPKSHPFERLAESRVLLKLV